MLSTVVSIGGKEGLVLVMVVRPIVMRLRCRHRRRREHTMVVRTAIDHGRGCKPLQG